MPTLLRLDASVRGDDSHSRAVADHFVSRWSEAHPGGTVRIRDLTAPAIPHLDGPTVGAFFGGDPTEGSSLSDALISELFEADHLLVAAPIYNFMAPSPLKAYFDHVSRAGRTFVLEDDGPRGILTDLSATLVVARGWRAPDPLPAPPSAADDHCTPWLRTILHFIGVSAVDVVPVDGTAEGEECAEEARARGKRSIDRIFAPESETRWVGEVSRSDRLGIGELRSAHAAAIVAGDALAYADLCCEDAQLLLPEHAPVEGREALRAVEATLFARTRFLSFRKIPNRVEVHGDVAIETGVQEVSAAPHSSAARGGSGAVALPRQKYTHVLRRVEGEWRFAVLISNAGA